MYVPLREAKWSRSPKKNMSWNTTTQLEQQSYICVRKAAHWRRIPSFIRSMYIFVMKIRIKNSSSKENWKDIISYRILRITDNVMLSAKSQNLKRKRFIASQLVSPWKRFITNLWCWFNYQCNLKCESVKTFHFIFIFLIHSFNTLFAWKHVSYQRFGKEIVSRAKLNSDMRSKNRPYCRYISSEINCIS